MRQHRARPGRDPQAPPASHDEDRASSPGNYEKKCRLAYEVLVVRLTRAGVPEPRDAAHEIVVAVWACDLVTKQGVAPIDLLQMHHDALARAFAGGAHAGRRFTPASAALRNYLRRQRRWQARFRLDAAFEEDGVVG